MKPSIMLFSAALFAPFAAGAQQQPSAGAGSAAVSPDGTRIAFTSNRTGTSQIYSIESDGTHEVQLTRLPGPKGGPTWSADGQQLFYTALAHDSTTIFLVDHGGAVHQVGVVAGRMVAFSPDRRRIAYTAGTWTANKVIVADLGGSHPRQITDSVSIAWNLRWSPDATQLAFTGRPGPGDGLAVFVMNIDGSGRRQITHIGAERGNAQLPAWSPDGRRFAIQVSDTGRTGGIWVVDIATGAARELAPHQPGYEDEIPTWFPDGKRIAFQSDRTGRMEIWTINADGSGIRQLTGRAP